MCLSKNGRPKPFYSSGVYNSIMKELRESHLVQELKNRSDELEAIPVLIGSNFWEIDDIGGGYSGESDTLILELYGGSPPSSESDKYEIHVEGAAFWLNIEETVEIDDGLRLVVDGYFEEPFSFADELNEDVDKRETRFEHDNRY